MKKILQTLAISFVTITFLYGNASALSLGTNITISDENSSASTGWYSNQEDQEVEPGMVAKQSWDLEGFFLDGTMLSMMGGYDFKNGVDGFDSGDIFIDTDGDAVFGDIHGFYDGNKTVKNTFGYDYVLDLDFTTFTYELYSINENADVESSYYKQNQGSNPWRYVGGGVSRFAGTFGYNTGYTDAETGFLGGTHNLVSGFDLAFIAGEDFTAHFTMGCGNDNLMGQSNVPTPEPATMILLGTGLIGLGGLRRRSARR